MNKIFKTIWNHATQSLVVVSELVKSRHKTASSSNQSGVIEASFSFNFSRSLIASLVGLVFAFSSFNVNADVRIGSTNGNSISASGATVTTGKVRAQLANYNNPDNEYYSSDHSDGLYNGGSNASPISIGNKTRSQTGGVSIGDYAYSEANLAIALGAYTKSMGISSVAIGSGSLASAMNSFAIGRQSSATKDFSLAFGTVARANATSSIAIGGSAFANKDYAIAIGSSMPAGTLTYDRANNTVADAQRAVALGYNSKATLEDSVAIGSYSNTTAGVAATDQTISGHKYTFSGTPITNNNHVFSVGSAQHLRQIQNVASGRVVSGSTDAINGGQLFSALTTVGNVLNTKADKATTYKFKVGTQDAKTWTLANGNDVTFTSGNSNIVASAVQNSGIQYTLNNTLNLGSTGSLRLGNTNNNDGIFINNSGINAGGKAISNIKEETPAANGKFAATTGQLFSTNTNVTNLNKKIDTVNTTLTNNINNVNKTLNTKIDTVNTTLTNNINNVNKTLNTKIDTVNTTLTNNINNVNKTLDTKIGDVNTKLTKNINDVNSTLNTKIEGVNTNVTKLANKQKQDHEALDTKITESNKRISASESNITKLQTFQQTASGQISTLQNNVADHGRKIQSLESTTSSHTNQIADLTGKVNTFGAHTYNVKNNVNDSFTVIDGQAGALSTNKMIFGATSDLSVDSDGKGNIRYGLSKTTKDDITTAKNNAKDALEKAGKAEANATKALTAAEKAEANATNALSTAQRAEANSSTAISTANEAKGIAEQNTQTITKAIEDAKQAATQNTKDLTTAVNEAKQSATQASETANAASQTATNAATKVGELEKRSYTFKVKNSDGTVTAQTWSLSKDGDVTFAAGDGLTVTSDAKTGTVTYGLSEAAKNSIESAKTAADTVTNKLTDINNAVKKAEDAKTAAAASAEAAKGSAEAAKGSAETASTISISGSSERFSGSSERLSRNGIN